MPTTNYMAFWTTNQHQIQRAKHTTQKTIKGRSAWGTPICRLHSYHSSRISCWNWDFIRRILGYHFHLSPCYPYSRPSLEHWGTAPHQHCHSIMLSGTAIFTGSQISTMPFAIQDQDLHWRIIPSWWLSTKLSNSRIHHQTTDSSRTTSDSWAPKLATWECHLLRQHSTCYAVDM